MDDTTLLTTDRGIQQFNDQQPPHQAPVSSSLLDCTNSNTQKYSQILRTCGGQLAPDKCNVYLLKPKWRQDRCSFCPARDYPGSVEVQLNLSEVTTLPLNRRELTEAHRTLGVYIAPDGSNGTQVAVLA